MHCISNGPLCSKYLNWYKFITAKVYVIKALRYIIHYELSVMSKYSDTVFTSTVLIMISQFIFVAHKLLSCSHDAKDEIADSQLVSLSVVTVTHLPSRVFWEAKGDNYSGAFHCDRRGNVIGIRWESCKTFLPLRWLSLWRNSRRLLQMFYEISFLY